MSEQLQGEGQKTSHESRVSSPFDNLDIKNAIEKCQLNTKTGKFFNLQILLLTTFIQRNEEEEIAPFFCNKFFG